MNDLQTQIKAILKDVKTGTPSSETAEKIFKITEEYYKDYINPQYVIDILSSVNKLRGMEAWVTNGHQSLVFTRTLDEIPRVLPLHPVMEK